MKDKKKDIYKIWGSFLVRKAQQHYQQKGIVPTDENVRKWLQENYPRKKSTLKKYGVPQ